MSAQLCVVTCHFNPAGYERPRNNYYRFMAQMRQYGVPVRTVELLFDDDPLYIQNAVHLRVSRERGLFWQKEALLNVAIQDVVDDFEAVAWVDADVTFLNPTWAEDCLRELERCAVVQLFSEAHLTDADAEIARSVKSVGFRWSTRDARWSDLGQSHPGLAWAARSEVLQHTGGLYPYVLSGCGDTMMLPGFTSAPVPGATDQLSRELAGDLAGWHSCCADAVGGELGFVMGGVVHMYHGTMANRQCLERRSFLRDLDPERHVKTRRDGALEWTDEAPCELRERLAQYFFSRKEDD